MLKYLFEKIQWPFYLLGETLFLLTVILQSLDLLNAGYDMLLKGFP